jgi:hypothetical protein
MPSVACVFYRGSSRQPEADLEAPISRPRTLFASMAKTIEKRRARTSQKDLPDYTLATGALNSTTVQSARAAEPCQLLEW